MTYGNQQTPHPSDNSKLQKKGDGMQRQGLVCCIIGSGNLATHLSVALHDAGFAIAQIYSPTASHAQRLADRVGAEAVSKAADIMPDADVYVISVKDDAIASVLSSLPAVRRDSVIVHTAGSVHIDILRGHAAHYAVLYPMQTFSLSRDVDFSEIPCFIEASDDYALNAVRGMAESVSRRVVELDSARRRKLHLAAVFASNMTNHCYRLAERILAEDGLDFSLLLPLIGETARKVTEMSPRDAQTGPMVRNDHTVMEAQLSLLHDERMQAIYRLMAESVYADKLNEKPFGNENPSEMKNEK